MVGPRNQSNQQRPTDTFSSFSKRAVEVGIFASQKEKKQKELDISIRTPEGSLVSDHS
jgi:hypothetical protein